LLKNINSKATNSLFHPYTVYLQQIQGVLKNFTKQRNYFLLCLLLVSLSLETGLSQTVLTEADFKPVEPESVVVVDHSPRKATLYSAVLPGLGQAYNKKYWKIPIVYAGFGVLGYFIYFNAENYNEYKQALIDFIDEDSGTNSYLNLIGPNVDPGTFDPSLGSPLYRQDNEEWFKTQLENNMDYYKRYRDLSIIISIGWYVLNIIDAAVDAYLFDYDITDDLSMRIDPKLFQFTGKPSTVGLQFSLNF